jgi:excisionase family DNA binding protein
METSNNSSQVLTISELCEELRISRTTAWRLLNAGELQWVRLGKRSVRVIRSSILTYLQRHEQAC